MYLSTGVISYGVLCFVKIVDFFRLLTIAPLYPFSALESRYFRYAGLDSPLVGGDRHWDAVQDLDRFLTDLYQYYYEGGYRDVPRNVSV